MAVKILIKRKFKEGELKSGCKLITQARYSAMDQKGYISSETLSNIEDPNELVVVSMWQNLDSWDRWAKSELRKDSEDEIQKILDSPTEYEKYNLGVELE